MFENIYLSVISLVVNVIPHGQCDKRLNVSVKCERTRPVNTTLLK